MAFLRSSTATSSYVELTQPFTDPANTVRAQSVAEMYSMVVSADNLYFRYALGSKTTTTSYTLRFRNNSPSHGLLVTFDTSQAVMVRPVGVTNDYSVAPLATVDFIVSLNDDFVKQRNMEHLYNDIVRMALKVEPINVAGPVFVRNNLPPVSF